ncbi:hypothetical protein Tco_0276402 [Tanacetum coccineum]
MGSNEETNAAGTDTRPPMLVESDYDSWKIRIHRYIRGKPNGKLIWKSIQNGPTPHPMITDPPPTDSAAVPAPREKLDSEFSEEENKLEMADTQAEIILSQGLPRHIFNNLNQTSTAKEIWDNVELLMQGSGRTIQQRKEDLFDEYERFRAIGNESPILTTLFLLSLKWCPKAVPPQQQLPTFLQLKGLLLRCIWSTMVTEQFKRGEGHVARQCTEPKRKMDSQYFKDKALLMEAKEKGDVLDAEAEAFLADVECTAPYDQHQALTTTNMCQAYHEDEYDSAWMKAHCVVALWPILVINLVQSTIQSMRYTTMDNQIFVNVDYQIQGDDSEEHLDSDAETEMMTLRFRIISILLGHRSPNCSNRKKEKSLPFYNLKKENILSEKKDLADSYLDEIKELYGDQAYWLSANEIASQASKPVKPATPFVHKSRPPSQVLASLRKVNAVFPQFEVLLNKQLGHQLQEKDEIIQKFRCSDHHHEVLNVGYQLRCGDLQAFRKLTVIQLKRYDSSLRIQIDGLR